MFPQDGDEEAFKDLAEEDDEEERFVDAVKEEEEASVEPKEEEASAEPPEVKPSASWVHHQNLEGVWERVMIINYICVIVNYVWERNTGIWASADHLHALKPIDTLQGREDPQKAEYSPFN